VENKRKLTLSLKIESAKYIYSESLWLFVIFVVRLNKWLLSEENR